MRATRAAAGVILMVAALVGPGSSAAKACLGVGCAIGGDRIRVPNDHHVAGSRSVANVRYLGASNKRVRAHSPYYLYVSPLRSGWRLSDARAPSSQRAGAVELVAGRGKGNALAARVELIVPKLASGRYLMTLCDSDCTHRLGRVPTTCCLSIVQSAAEARLWTRIDGLQARLAASRAEVRRSEERQEQSIASLDAQITRDGYVMAEEVSSLREQVTSLRRAGSEEPAWPVALVPIGVVLSLICGLLLGRRRRPRDDPDDLDAELRRLQEAPRAPEEAALP